MKSNGIFDHNLQFFAPLWGRHEKFKFKSEIALCEERSWMLVECWKISLKKTRKSGALVTYSLRSMCEFLGRLYCRKVFIYFSEVSEWTSLSHKAKERLEPFLILVLFLSFLICEAKERFFFFLFRTWTKCENFHVSRTHLRKFRCMGNPRRVLGVTDVLFMPGLNFYNFYFILSAETVTGLLLQSI